MDDSIGCSLRSDDEGKHYQNPLIERVSAITAGKRSLAPGLSVGVVDALKKIKGLSCRYIRNLLLGCRGVLVQGSYPRRPATPMWPATKGQIHFRGRLSLAWTKMNGRASI
ncbi:uncharacterized protein [Triticum aestivum]|uniref:uncharacterized protein isoform X2 n=1 Tax=Triticum aestivum TaxID=4565 RepID=UPI001D02674B|nr:uncharacterized protein LOC123091992 isoform X2 [Triticum aestivum]